MRRGVCGLGGEGDRDTVVASCRSSAGQNGDIRRDQVPGDKRTGQQGTETDCKQSERVCDSGTDGGGSEGGVGWDGMG